MAFSARQEQALSPTAVRNCPHSDQPVVIVALLATPAGARPTIAGRVPGVASCGGLREHRGQRLRPTVADRQGPATFCRRALTRALRSPVSLPLHTASKRREERPWPIPENFVPCLVLLRRGSWRGLEAGPDTSDGSGE